MKLSFTKLLAYDMPTGSAAALPGYVSRRSKKGVVLLIVVVMLAVVCIMLVQLATLSFSRIRDVVDRQDELRSRWAIVSLRRSCLPRAASLLGSAQQWQALDSVDSETKSFAPITHIGFTIEISNWWHEVQMGDESAKLCLPSFARIREDDTLSGANRLLQRSGARIREDAFSDPRVEGYRWHDILDQRLAGDTRLSIDEIGAQLTIWGDGQLNVFRAEDEVLQEAWRIAFGRFPPSAIREAREVYPPRSWRAVRESLAMREEELRTLDRCFSGDSDCFSLTIYRRVGDRLPRRRWMFVSDRDARQHGLEF